MFDCLTRLELPSFQASVLQYSVLSTQSYVAN